MIAATLLLLAQAAPAAPAPTPQAADARCIAAFSVLGTDAKTPEVLRAAQMGALFFYGKVLGRNPAIDLPAAMTEAMRTARVAQQAELTRCGTELQRSGEAMQALESPPGAAPAPQPAPLPTPTPRK